LPLLFGYLIPKIKISLTYFGYKMRKFAIYVVILSTFIPFTHSYSAEWTKFATMKVQSTDVTLFGDKTSLQIDENDDSKRTLLVKF